MKLDEIAALSSSDRQGYFAVAADSLPLPSIAVVEKDFWVCWLLQKFFSLDGEFGPFTFKGGTSLSKCFDLISRFSEDIDIGVERKTIGYGDDSYFYDAPSKTKRIQRVDEQNAKSFEWLHQRIAPRLRQIASEVLGDSGWEFTPNNDAPDRLCFNYPRESAPSQYLSPEVLIEFGTLDAWPVEEVAIRPYIGALPELSSLEATTVRALDPTRTFWEKAVILHRFAHFAYDRPFPAGKSRHYYDVMMIYRARKTDILNSVGLLPIIARYKDTFYPLGYARYDLAEDPQTLLLIPPAHLQRDVERDYETIATEMIFPSSTPPTFADIMTELTELQKRIHAIRL